MNTFESCFRTPTNINMEFACNFPAFEKKHPMAQWQFRRDVTPKKPKKLGLLEPSQSCTVTTFLNRPSVIHCNNFFY